MTQSPFELGTDGPSRILVGVDGSETSIRAGAYAVGMARRAGARLFALHVMTTPVATVTPVGAPEVFGAVVACQQEYVNQLRRDLDEAARIFGVHVDLVVRRGNPYKELAKVADELRVDAVVIGASMQSGHRIVGSLATRLVRDAAWPVTVVP